MSKVKAALRVKDFHKMYRIRCLDKGLTPKSLTEYRKIILAMGDIMTDLLLEEGIVSIPWKIGDVFLKQTVNVKEMIQSEKGGKRKKVKYFSDHTDGINYKSFWLSPERQHKKRKGWSFALYHPTRRRLKDRVFAGKRYTKWEALNERSQFRGTKKAIV